MNTGVTDSPTTPTSRILVLPATAALAAYSVGISTPSKKYRPTIDYISASASSSSTCCEEKKEYELEEEKDLLQQNKWWINNYKTEESKCALHIMHLERDEHNQISHQQPLSTAAGIMTPPTRETQGIFRRTNEHQHQEEKGGDFEEQRQDKEELTLPPFPPLSASLVDQCTEEDEEEDDDNSIATSNFNTGKRFGLCSFDSNSNTEVENNYERYKSLFGSSMSFLDYDNNRNSNENNDTNTNKNNNRRRRKRGDFLIPRLQKRESPTVFLDDSQRQPSSPIRRRNNPFACGMDNLWW